MTGAGIQFSIPTMRRTRPPGQAPRPGAPPWRRAN